MEPADHLCQAVDSITSFGKFAQLTRPASPHPDLQFQFAYSKAKPHQLDLTRKQTQNLRTKSNVDRLEPARSVGTPINPHIRPIETQNPESTQHEERHASKDSAETSAPNIPTKHTAFTDPTDVGDQSGQVTNMVEATVVPGSCTAKYNIQNNSPSAEHAEPPLATSPVQKVIAQKERYSQTNARKASITRQGHTVPYPTVSKASSNGELMGILLSRFEAEQQSREELQASQLAKDIEIQDLYGVSQNLNQLLQEAKDRERIQNMEISEFEKLKLQWQHRIQQMNGYIQSFAEDHQKLRREAKEIREQQKHIQTERGSLEAALKEAHHVVDQDRSRARKILTEARHEMELLKHTVEKQKGEISQNADLLLYERDRSQGLANTISNLTTKYQDLTILFTNYRDAVMDKLGNLLERSDDQIANAPEPQQDLKPTMDQCLQELRELDVVKQKDFLSLKRSLNSYATRHARRPSSFMKYAKFT